MTTETLEAIDAALAGRALVYGSLPPDGRDLDLLVRPTERTRLERALAELGFERRGDIWARFGPGAADVVDVTDAAVWTLPPAEIEALFTEAVPLAGLVNLVRPSEPHRTLIRERRERAAETRLRRRSVHGALRRLRILRRGGLVVTLSGLDGAGKSSQATALVRALDAAGVAAVAEWMPFGQNRAVERASALARVLIALARRTGRAGTVHEHVSAGGSLLAAPGAETARAPRERALLHAWITVVALANALHQRRVVTRHALRGRLVVFDRYTLDSVVRLRYLYGARERFPVQAALIRLLSPRPLQSFLLEVRPEAALARKQDQWSLDDLTRQFELYREEAGELGVPRLDGERAADDLSAEIARAVWRALP